MAEKKSIVITPDMIRAGVDVLRASEFNNDNVPYAVEGHEEIVTTIFLAMCRASQESANTIPPSAADNHQSNAPRP